MPENSFRDIGSFQERYRILARLGRGGMADVFLGIQLGEVSFSRLVVIKAIRSILLAKHDAMRMFINEAKTVASLNHPHIVQIYDLSRLGKDVCITMEYVKGETLHYIWRYLRHFKKRIPIPVLCKMVVEACEALHFAHSACNENGEQLDIIHRDIGPSNLMLDRAGFLKIIDFGIAKSTAQDGLTSPGVIKGKFSYIAPDMFMFRDIDNRVDLYALGLVMYELATLRKCFDFDKDVSIVELMERLTTEHFPKPSSVFPDLSEEFDELIEKATHKEREHRFRTGEEFAQAIRDFAKNVGGLATTTQVADWFGRMFKERIEKRRMFEKNAMQKASGIISDAGSAVEETLQPELTGGTNLDDGSRIESSQDGSSGSRRFRPLLAVLAVLFVAVGAVLGVLLHSPDDEEGTTPGLHDEPVVPASSAGKVAPEPEQPEKPPVPRDDTGQGGPRRAPETVDTFGESPDDTTPTRSRTPRINRRIRKRRPHGRSARASRDNGQTAGRRGKVATAVRAPGRDEDSRMDEDAVSTKRDKHVEEERQPRPSTQPGPDPKPPVEFPGDEGKAPGDEVEPTPPGDTKPPADTRPPTDTKPQAGPELKTVASQSALPLFSGDGSWTGMQVATKGCTRCHNGVKVKKLAWDAKTRRQWQRFFKRNRHDRHIRLREKFSAAELRRVEKYILLQEKELREKKKGIAGVK